MLVYLYVINYSHSSLDPEALIIKLNEFLKPPDSKIPMMSN